MEINVTKLEEVKDKIEVMQHAFNVAIDTRDVDCKMNAINLFIDLKYDAVEILDDLIKGADNV